MRAAVFLAMEDQDKLEVTVDSLDVLQTQPLFLSLIVSLMFSSCRTKLLWSTRTSRNVSTPKMVSVTT